MRINARETEEETFLPPNLKWLNGDPLKKDRKEKARTKWIHTVTTGLEVLQVGGLFTAYFISMGMSYLKLRISLTKLIIPGLNPTISFLLLFSFSLMTTSFPGWPKLSTWGLPFISCSPHLQLLDRGWCLLALTPHPFLLCKHMASIILDT